MFKTFSLYSVSGSYASIQLCSQSCLHLHFWPPHYADPAQLTIGKARAEWCAPPLWLPPGPGRVEVGVGVWRQVMMQATIPRRRANQEWPLACTGSTFLLLVHAKARGLGADQFQLLCLVPPLIRGARGSGQPLCQVPDPSRASIRGACGPLIVFFPTHHPLGSW